jgi:hypothetical protein
LIWGAGPPLNNFHVFSYETALNNITFSSIVATALVGVKLFYLGHNLRKLRAFSQCQGGGVLPPSEVPSSSANYFVIYNNANY